MGKRKVERVLSESERETLEVIRRCAAAQGYPPSILELAEMRGLSHATVHEHVGRLVRKGYLRREAGKARGLTVVQGGPLSTPGTKNDARDKADLVPIPVIGVVAAGPPLLAEENVVGKVSVGRDIVARCRCFALRVEGDSMTGAGIRNADTLIVRQQPVAESGDIVVALLNNEGTVKRLVIREDVIELRPENKRYRPIRVEPDDDLRIVGKVLGVRKRDRGC